MPKSIIFVLLAVVATVGGCGWNSATTDEKADKKRAEPSVLVRVVQPRRGTLIAKLEITAVVEAHARADVFPRVEGTVARVTKFEGDAVREGDVLAELSHDEWEIDRRAKELGVELAAHAVKLAELNSQEMAKQLEGRVRTFDREKSLLQRSKEQRAAEVITDQDLELAQYNFDRAQADKEAAEIAASKAAEDVRVAQTRGRESATMLDSAKLRCEWASIRATVNGRITERHVKQGQKASPAQPAYSIADFDSLVINPAVPQKDLRSIRTGLAVFVTSTAYPDRVFGGTVEFISPQVDTQGGTIQCRIRLAKSEPSLLPGMFVSGHLVVDEKTDILLVPKKALLFERDRPYVYVVDGVALGERRARKFYMERGLENDTDVEYVPVAGQPAQIDDSSRIVLVGMDRLVDASLVEIEDRADPTATMTSSRPTTNGEPEAATK